MRPRRRLGPPRSDRAGVAIVVRTATPDDAAAVTALRLTLLREDAPHGPLGRPRARAEARARRSTESQLAEAHRHPDRQVVFVAQRGARLVGVLRCVAGRSSSLARPGRYAFVTTVFVRASHRRQGVLRGLLQAADAWARTHRLEEMRLHCAVRNQAGNAAWAALGFAPAEILYRRVIPAEPAAS